MPIVFLDADTAATRAAILDAVQRIGPALAAACRRLVLPGRSASAEDGGYRLNGRWRFCSGIRHSELVSVAAVVLAVDIASSAYRYGGASTLYQPNILERLLRDIQAAAQHIAVSDAAYEVHGKHILGLADAGA